MLCCQLKQSETFSSLESRVLVRPYYYGDTEYLSKRINGILEEKNYRDNGYLK